MNNTTSKRLLRAIDKSEYRLQDSPANKLHVAMEVANFRIATMSLSDLRSFVFDRLTDELVLGKSTSELETELVNND